MRANANDWVEWGTSKKLGNIARPAHHGLMAMGDRSYADYSGFGQKPCLPTLIDAGCEMVVSGHTHQHRIDSSNHNSPSIKLLAGGRKSKTPV